MYEFHYSTRNFGDMRSSKNREAFLNYHKLDSNPLIIPEQIHGNKVAVVSNKEAGMKMQGYDGLVSGDDSIVLGVLAADCVPLLFVDPKQHVLGVAHAGWRGTLANIASNTVEAMKKMGSRPKDIIVSIGPHIESCCYDVPGERALKFRHVFGNFSVYEGKNRWQIDLGKANYLGLTNAGIDPTHIKQSAVCTCCDNHYFSYRRDSKETFGEMLGVVTWK